MWPLLIILLILFTYYIYKKEKTNISCYNYIIGALVSVYAMIMSPSFPLRAWLGIVIFLIISIVTLLDKILKENKLMRYIVFDGILIFIFLFVFDYYQLALDLKHYQDVLAYRESYIEDHRDEMDTFVFESYEINNKKSPIHGKDLDTEDTFWTNQAFARYYDVKSIIGY